MVSYEPILPHHIAPTKKQTKIQRIHVTRQLSTSRVGCRKVSPDDLERLNACSLQYERASRSRRDETLIIFRGPQPLQPLHKPGLHCSVPLIHNNAVRGKISVCNLCSSAVDLHRRKPLRCIPTPADRRVAMPPPVVSIFGAC